MSGDTLGVQRATVVNNEDPAGQGRVRLFIPRIFGDVATDWVEPTVSSPQVPPTGSTVWVLFHGGDVTKPVYVAVPPVPPAPNLTPYALDTTVVHLAGTETITGAKAFTGGLTSGGQNVVVTNDSRLSDVRFPNNDANLLHKTGAETAAGLKTFSNGIVSVGVTVQGNTFSDTLESQGNTFVGGNLEVSGTATAEGQLLVKTNDSRLGATAGGVESNAFTLIAMDGF